MTNQKLAEALLFHASQIVAIAPGIEPRRDIEAPRAEERGQLAHVLWMCDEAVTFIADGKIDKAMRWLGFIQGALWVMGVSTIEESKRANMPQGEEYKP